MKEVGAHSLPSLTTVESAALHIARQDANLLLSAACREHFRLMLAVPLRATALVSQSADTTVSGYDTQNPGVTVSLYPQEKQGR
ncbi:hypothetical protein EYF80_007991 [Liparis tanakae]|uniref:Uncharacterized protein n=1 Tax=Liparis tanakae TaxID=230148 RepID=A0A4Z2IX40_9TELE|nr:hypothetical protein EYF80_007991 [Liparis tanakae]